MTVLRNILRHIFLYINCGLVIGILLAYLSIYISPRDFSLLAYFGLAYPYLLLFNILFIIFWIYKKRVYFLISLLAIGIGWAHISSFIAINLDKEKSNVKESYKLLSYNVRLFDRYDWTKKRGTREKIFFFLEDEKPDILCVQEFYTKNKTGKESVGNKINDQLKLTNQHIAYAREKGKEYNYGIATFSKHKIINTGTIDFEDSNNFCIFSDIKLKNDTVRVYNVHLESVHFQKEDYRFIDSIEHKLNNEKISGLFGILQKINTANKKRAHQIEIIYQHQRKSPYPSIITGDFNDTPISYTYHKAASELEDAFLKSGNGLGITYHRKIFPFRIDYILHNNPILSFDFQTYDLEFSDHKPVSAMISLK